MNCGLRRIFWGHLPVTFFVILLLKYFFVSTSKKICDGRRKTKIKKLTSKNGCEKIKKVARAATLTTYKWYEFAVRPSISKISLARKLGFVHLIHIIHLVLCGPYSPFFRQTIEPQIHFFMKGRYFFMSISKARFWATVLYPENMIENWESKIDEILQIPYCYIIHNMDKDTKSEHRKDHVHLMLVFPNTTTQKHALAVANQLSKEEKKAASTIQAVIGIRNVYDYFIHDTESSRKAGKELYDASQRITGNGFDIGSYEQLGVAEKNDMCKELCNLIREKRYTNFADFFEFVIDNYEDTNYFEIVKTYSGLFERYTKANFQKWQMGELKK